MKDVLLFLDFDGVLCDSIPECFESSFRALYPGLSTDSLGSEYREQFRNCRPFIRSGEDYLLLHTLIKNGRQPVSQAEFDAELLSVGKEQMADWKKKLYQVRDSFLENERSRWIEMNPLYPGVAHELQILGALANVYILSTKYPAFIAEILLAKGISFPLERILHPGAKSKLEIIQSLAREGQTALLLDDQIDALLPAASSQNVIPALAGWGYILPAWKQDTRVTLWELKDFGKNCRDFLSAEDLPGQVPGGN